jgi:hypothetical protein
MVWHCAILLLMFHLNRLGTCSHMHMTKQKSIKPWWFILPQSSYVTFIPLLILFCRKHDYDSYCFLDCRSQSFASLHLYWVWALLMHPTPKNPKFSKSVHHIYLLASFLFQVYSSCFYLSFKLKMFAMRKLVSKALMNLMAHFIFLHIRNLNHCDYLMKLYACKLWV